jgi:Ca-activated chloride channel family protein
VPPGGDTAAAATAPLKYQETRIKADAGQSDDLMSVRLRYKPIGADTSRLIETVVVDRAASLADTSDDFRFSAAVAGFGMLLRDSSFKGDLTWNDVLALARGADGPDENGDRAEMIRLVQTCRLLQGK